jgi:hypothetical protein
MDAAQQAMVTKLETLGCTPEQVDDAVALNNRLRAGAKEADPPADPVEVAEQKPKPRGLLPKGKLGHRGGAQQVFGAGGLKQARRRGFVD